jgi:PAS domain S-box-containing protein
VLNAFAFSFAKTLFAFPSKSERGASRSTPSDCAILKQSILIQSDTGAEHLSISTFGDPYDSPRMTQNVERVSNSKPPKDTPWILLIEADFQKRQDVTRLLVVHYGIHATADTSTVFRLARERSPDLMLANVMMLKLDGFDLLHQFRQNEDLKAVPIILYSSPNEEELCLEGMEAGANDYLITPFSERQLLARVRRQLQAAQVCDESFRALRASEERYRTLATAMNTGIWSAAPNGDVFGEAHGWEKMTGQTAEEYRGYSWMSVVHRDDRQQLLETWQQALRDAAPVEVDYRVRQRDGSYHYIRTQAAPISNPDGSVREWIGTVVDIDDRKRAEEALRTSEAEFRANFELAGIGQAQVDPKTGQLLRVNPRLCEMLGYSADELLTMTFWDFTHAQDRQRNAVTIQPFLNGETGEYTIEKRYVRKDGSIMWGLITATMIRDAEGHPLRTVAMIQDITDRRQSETLSRSQKVALEMVAQGASLSEVLQFVVASLEKLATEDLMVSILLFDGDGKHLKLGAASGLPEGYIEKFREGVSVNDLSGPCRSVVAARKPVIVADLTNDPNWQEFRDRVAPYGFRAAWSTPIVSSDQRLLGSFCIYYRHPRTPSSIEQWMIEGVNHTVALAIERKQAEAEREELLIREQTAREHAESANRVKDEFLAVVSHELRTPLTAISGWTHLLLEGKLADTAQLRALEAIQRQARSQAQLIDDLLDVSRIVSGKLRLNWRAVDPTKIINNAIDVVRPTAETKNVRLVIELDVLQGTVSGDPERLQQVIWNLLSNAIKFTPEGGRVDIHSRWFESSIEIVVADTGQGISEDFLPYIFERFRQADVSTTRTHGGLGLGLAIVRHLIEIHGGTVRAQSAGKGKGATFTIRLPGRVITRSRERREPQQEIPMDKREILEGLRILVVDDDSDAREILAVQLTHQGATTAVSASADDALRKLDTFRPDIIVADIGMPGEDGYSLIRKVRNRPLGSSRQTPAIALTAYAGDGNRQRALNAGYQKHISKPAQPEELALTIADLVRRR